MNPFAEKFTGWTLKEASGQHLDQVFRLFDEETRLPIQNVYDFSMGLSEIDGLSPDILLVPRASRIEFSISIDSEYSIEITASHIRDRKDSIIGTVLVFHDVTEMKGMAKQLSYHATHDSLTGLMNRREFENEIDHAITSAQREQIEHVLMYLDLDQFKIVNDTCGHLAGDELLRQISMLLHGIIRNVDTISRLGGDEFGVLLFGCGLDNATRIAEKLRQSVKDYKFAWKGKSFDIGASIGLVAVTSETTNKAEALSAADSACYVAKDQGRNRIHIYLPDDESIALRQGELMWIQKIKDAMIDDRLRLYYQPVMPLNERKNAKVYCEFLLGMLDKNGKIVPPMAFIPAAERYQIMSSIDRWVIQTILRMAAEKNDIFERYDIFAINLSGQSLCDNDFLDFILVQLADQAIDPTKICFEITETAAIANFQLATQFISKLRSMGCSFALDDFGSGLSSFAYLKKLNVDYLKIDGSFVKDLHEDPVNHAMVQAINQLGHVMGKKTIAEFVESKSLLTRLRKIGVDYAQGYAVQRPQLLDMDIKPQKLKNFKA
jgi:diguanylate cyclase (GGDEF)-like protein